MIEISTVYHVLFNSIPLKPHIDSLDIFKSLHANPSTYIESRGEPNKYLQTVVAVSMASL